ncbi:cytochrome c peroxidase [Pedobacter cryoconitis]|uniref:Cytochrome c peroxidase n=1 Tax=Pedobacter cryoconitis TaxID=188932 RepID=A0A7W9DYV1_9SPHI|nr:cytochrome c peroxidase [Pedobacter cryoconitis]MBB5636622.1 cytochrome c peroxidase [Pedobacter cryoconitis]
MSGLNIFRYFISASLLMVILVVSSCKKEGAAGIMTVLHPVELAIPENFSRPAGDLDNPLTSEGIALGKMLFYDTRLSGNNRLSCASCHRPELAFSDGVALSHIGESGKTLPRHSPALINMAWMNKGLFWDGGSTNLESQAFGPLTSEDEMYQNLAELEYELSQVPAYVKQFKMVFNSQVKSAAIVKALAQFERTLISGDSRYDRYVRKEPGGVLSAEELHGLTLVNQKCRSCHAGELFTDNDFHNNGLDQDFSDSSLEGIFQGRYRITYQLTDLGKFKTPTLRNVMLTAPYMHDGRFASIDQVLTHYQKNTQLAIPLSAAEKKAIIAFLGSLTDSLFIQNKNLSQPI